MIRSVSGLFSGLYLAALAPTIAYAQTVPTAISEQVALSVVEVTATQCSDGQSRVGSGFAYEDRNQIVTAYHVVAGCQTFNVFFEKSSGQPTLSGTLTKSLPTSDLAMLVVQAPDEVVPLSARQAPIGKDAPLAVVGFFLNQSTLSNLDLRISIGDKKLKSFLPSSLRDELKSKTKIDLEAEVFRFNGFLEPGLSGGPVVDDDGRVVAIVAGGLQNGAAPVSWGWRADLLSTLLTSNSDGATANGTASSLFSTAATGGNIQTVSCGDLAFDLVDNLSYLELWSAADDRQVVAQVASMSLQPQSEINDYRFNVWRNAESGATLTIPEGANLTSQGGGCVATSGAIEQIVYAKRANSDAEVQQISLQFESATLAKFPGYFWNIDPKMTQGMPIFRPDGFAVNRKGAVGGSAMFPGHPYTTEKIMAKRGTFVGVAMTNGNYGPQYAQCNANPFVPGCDSVLEELTTFAQFVLATHLSTYAIY